MADENELDIDEVDAEKLLADPDDAPKNSPEASETDDKDWKVEAERWKKLSRQNEATAKQRADALKKYEDANKSAAERLQEAAASNLTRAERAEFALRRREIAENKAPEHATITQIKAVAKRLTGDTDDDLEKDADELFALLAPEPASAPASKTPTRPKERLREERLRGGADPDEPVEESDPRKLAALIPRRS